MVLVAATPGVVVNADVQGGCRDCLPVLGVPFVRQAAVMGQGTFPDGDCPCQARELGRIVVIVSGSPGHGLGVPS